MKGFRALVGRSAMDILRFLLCALGFAATPRSPEQVVMVVLHFRSRARSESSSEVSGGSLTPLRSVRGSGDVSDAPACGFQTTSNGHPNSIESASNIQRKCIEGATKAHLRSGLWKTI